MLDLTEDQKTDLAYEAHNQSNRGEMVDWEVREYGDDYMVRITLEVIVGKEDVPSIFLAEGG